MERERYRLTDLSNDDILEALANRAGFRRAKEALENAARMLRTAAKAEPALKAGLHSGASLLEIYMEYLEPTGKLQHVPLEKVVSALRNSETKPLSVALPIRTTAVIRKTSPASKVKVIARRILALSGDCFCLKQIDLQGDENSQDVKNALAYLKKKDKITKNPRHGFYDFVRTDGSQGRNETSAQDTARD